MANIFLITILNKHCCFKKKFSKNFIDFIQFIIKSYPLIYILIIALELQIYMST